ncbi:MAG: hypothetical protein ABR520_04810 [Mycobacteriales bacterium]|nr:hypothetical protein [Frankia sp.]
MSNLRRIEFRGGGRKPQGVRALLWLKSREWLGESRDPSRLVLLGALVLAWYGLIILGSVRAKDAGRIDPDVALLFIAAAAWPLWAIIPLLGGGGGEIVAAHRLAPYPVTARAVFGGSWVTSLLDVPYVAILPVVLGMSVALAGWPGLGAALAFTAGASATGQLLAWVSVLVLSGRRRSALSALLLTGIVVGLLAVLPSLLPKVDEVAELLPGGWLSNAAFAARLHDWRVYTQWVALLLAPVPVALLLGPSLARLARDREASAGGVGARPWGAVTWSVRGSVLRALIVANMRSMTRAVGAQVAMAGVLSVPVLTRFPGIEFAGVSLAAMGSVAGIAAGTALGLNAFAFDAGGASALLSWPVGLRDVVIAKAVTIATCLVAAQLAVTALGAAMLRSPMHVVWHAALLCFARTAALTAIAVVWSVRFPAPSDYDSLRARISTPAAIMSFCLLAAVLTFVVGEFADRIGGVSGATTSLVAFGTLAAVGCRVALDDFRHGGLERVAAGVIG